VQLASQQAAAPANPIVITPRSARAVLANDCFHIVLEKQHLKIGPSTTNATFPAFCG
jgi:hypothetical protein